MWGFFIGEKRRMLAFVKRSANKKKDRERIERDFLLNTPPRIIRRRRIIQISHVKSEEMIKIGNDQRE